MARKSFRGPNGAVVTFEVPSPGMGRDYYDRKVAEGEYVELDTEVADFVPPPAEETGEAEVVDDPTADGAERPSRNDPKAAWVDYAVERGWVREDAENATKADLVEQTIQESPESNTGE